tara:strand:+ start:257 stop:619 length:363 start_codon:yes stop_codon:yes gene_type:complete
MAKRRKLDNNHLILDEAKNHKSEHSDDGALDDYDLFDIDDQEKFFRHIQKEVLLEYCLRTEAKKICFNRAIKDKDTTCVCKNPCLRVQRSNLLSHFKLNKKSTIWRDIVHRDAEYVKKNI